MKPIDAVFTISNKLWTHCFADVFFCKQIFKAYEVKEFINEPKGESTACCPYCDMDTLIGDASNDPITEEFWAEMNKKWF